jgi:hypothetical protein
VINELDAQALAFTSYMKHISGDQHGKIIVLSMGPPMAAEPVALPPHSRRV